MATVTTSDYGAENITMDMITTLVVESETPWSVIAKVAKTTGAFIFILPFLGLLWFKLRERLRGEAKKGQNGKKLETEKSAILNRVTRSLSRLTSRKARALLFYVDEKEDTKCSICLESLFESTSGGSEAGVVSYLKTCKHIFHFACIWDWLSSKPTCPICRTAVLKSSASIEAVSGAALKKLIEKDKPNLNVALNSRDSQRDLPMVHSETARVPETAGVSTRAQQTQDSIGPSERREQCSSSQSTNSDTRHVEVLMDSEDEYRNQGSQRPEIYFVEMDRPTDSSRTSNTFLY